MTSPCGSPIGGLATHYPSSAAINIPQTSRHICGCTCNCSCSNCSCRHQIDIGDPNREEYWGEGTAPGRGAQAVTSPTSSASSNSAKSVKESSDAPGPTATAAVSPPTYATIRKLHGRHDPTRIAQTAIDRFMNEPDDECPWKYFLEKLVTSNRTDEDMDFFGPMDSEDSTRNNAPLSNDEQAILSNYMSSLSPHPPSVGFSDIVRGAGGVFAPRTGAGPGHRYLRLN